MFCIKGKAMSNNEMSNETDLDWLARNVHVWPANTPHVIPTGDSVFEHGSTFYENHVCIYHKEYANSIVIYKKQWLARRAELQNKPSWKSISSSINYLSQCADGQWIGHHQMPEEGCEFFECDCEIAYYGYGEVLGRWCDTLEKRPYFSATNCTVTSSDDFGVTVGEPSDMSEQAVNERIREDGDNAPALDPEFKPSIEEVNRLAQEFKPFTSIEDNQEQEMKQDNGWFERGELPPVGVVCEAYITNPEQWIEAEIVSHKDGFAIGWCKSVMMGCHGDKAGEFRPIRTERDQLVEIITSKLSGTTGQVADAILAAGFKLEKK